MKLLGYANAFRIKQTCADKPGGAHLGQVAIYAGESVDPVEIQERENPTHMGEPVSCGPKRIGYVLMNAQGNLGRSAEHGDNCLHVAFVYEQSADLVTLADLKWPANAPHRLVPTFIHSKDAGPR